MRTQRVAVVGGGFVGLSTALLLRRAGHAVTLIEAGAGGALGASQGNAGACVSHEANFVCFGQRTLF